MNLKEMREYLKVTLELLKLSHWSVHLRWMTKYESEVTYSDCNGVVFWVPDHPSATILICKQCENIKHTITHECLHLRIEGYAEMRRNDDPHLEQAINAITDIIM